MGDRNERIDDDAIELVLGAALRERAERAVPLVRAVPPMSGSHSGGGRRAWWYAVPAVVVLVAAAAVTGVVIGRSGAARTVGGKGTISSPGTGPSVGHAQAGPTSGRSTGTGTSTGTAAPVRTVRVTALESDGGVYGVGMPIVLFASPAPTDASAFGRAVTVTVNGQRVRGAWYWERPTHDEVVSHTVEAHYRLSGYWPPDSRIHVSIPIGGLSAGRGLVFGDRLTSLDFRIGDAHVSTVSASGLTMRVRSNGRLVNTFKVSLGAAATPTFNGTKVVMQKGEDVPGTNRLRPDGTVLMSGPGYTDHPVPWSVRITRSGEYVHDAYWNSAIGVRSTSNGCTNLTPADAKWFYRFSQVGDVITYSGTEGRPMPVWDGLGDWNVAWPQWQQGGLLTP